MTVDSPYPHLLYMASTEYPYPEVEAWCTEYIGPHQKAWYKIGQDIAAVVVGYRSQEYWFRTPEDRLMFMLRWGT